MKQIHLILAVILISVLSATLTGKISETQSNQESQPKTADALYPELIDCERDNAYIKHMSLVYNYTAIGDNYLIDANIFALSTFNQSWTIRAMVMKGDAVNTTDKFETYLDEFDYTFNKQYETVTIKDGDQYALSSILYSNKTLQKANYYGSILTLVDNDTNIVYRKIGLWIYIGSIIIKEYYTSGWLDPNADVIAALTQSGAGGADNYLYAKSDNPAIRLITASTSYVYDVYEIEDYSCLDLPSFDASKGMNCTVENITVRAYLMRDLSTTCYVTSQLLEGDNTPIGSPVEVSHGAAGGIIKYMTHTAVNINMSNGDWNSTRIKIGMKKVGTGNAILCGVHMELEVEQWQEVTATPETSSSSSSGSGVSRILWEIIDWTILIEDLWISLENFQLYFGVIGAIIITSLGIRSKIITSKETKTQLKQHPINRISTKLDNYSKAYQKYKRALKKR